MSSHRGKRPLTSEEIAKCVDYLMDRRYSKRDITLFVLQSRTGYRIKEMLSLRICDVFPDFPKPTPGTDITVKRKNMKGGKKKNTNVSSRNMPIPPSCSPMLETYATELSKNGYESHDPLFPSSTTEKALTVNACSRKFRLVAKAVGLKGVGTHSMRKTFAKHIYDVTGHDIMETKAALGHSNVATTQNYLSFELGNKFREALRNE